jgi:hypothetical protein
MLADPACHSRFTVILIRVSLLFAVTALSALGFAAGADAKTITKIVETNIAFSVTRAADGTVTVQSTYKSSNPRCLGAKRWKTYSSGEIETGAPEFIPYYGDGWAEPPGRFGAQLLRVSPFGRSILLWKSVWAGDATTHVEGGGVDYTSTIGAAVGVDGGASLKAYEDVYKAGADKIVLKCRPASERLRNYLFP